MSKVANKPKLSSLIFTEIFVPRWTFDEQYVSQNLMKLPYIIAIEVQAGPQFRHGKTVTRMVVKSDPERMSELREVLTEEPRVIDFTTGI